MGKLVEDANVVTFAPGTPITSAGFLNEVQTQLRGCLKARELALFPAGYNEGAGAWTFTIGGGGDFYITGNAIGHNWIVPIPIYVGQKITQIKVTRASGNTSNGGACALYYGTEGSVLTAESIAASAPDPANWWRTGGIGSGNRATVTHTPAAAITLSASDQCFLIITGGTNAQIREIWDYRIIAQFGN